MNIKRVVPMLKKAKFISKKMLTSKVMELTFTPIEPENTIEFEAGQFISMKVSQDKFRSYSITSDPANHIEFKIIASVGHEGVGSKFMKQLTQNDKVEFIGPSGKFYLYTPFEKNLIFLVTGTGISTAISMLYKIMQFHKQDVVIPSIKLYFGVRDSSEVFYKDKLDEFTNTIPNFKYFICFSKDKTQNDPTSLAGRVTDNYSIAEPQQTHVYLCGHPAMVEENAMKLLQLGIPEENIFFEKFTRAGN